MNAILQTACRCRRMITCEDRPPTKIFVPLSPSLSAKEWDKTQSNTPCDNTEVREFILMGVDAYRELAFYEEVQP